MSNILLTSITETALELLPELVGAAVVATVEGGIAVESGKPNPIMLPVSGPGTADAEAPCPSRKPTAC